MATMRSTTTATSSSAASDRRTKGTALTDAVVAALALTAFYVTQRQLGDQRMQLGSGLSSYCSYPRRG